ncbi:hypothetical protein LCGC14_2186420 [marine sediment metagenome]|uniref:Uncharacterized protein n=1 Tax=marine sediment metagenome TaxID=412755 RepID=A0A0F9E7Y1_9ZZZZ
MASKISKSVMSDVSRSLERLATKHGGDILWRAVNRLANQRRERMKLKREIAKRRVELEALERRR